MGRVKVDSPKIEDQIDNIVRSILVSNRIEKAKFNLGFLHSVHSNLEKIFSWDRPNPEGLTNRDLLEISLIMISAIVLTIGTVIIACNTK